jgi:hypothetical protein
MKSISASGMLMTATFMAGCAGGPVGWGGSYDVLIANESKIKIQFDRTFVTEEAALQIAATHCEKHKKKAELSDVEKDSWTFGLVRNYTYLCK